MSLVGNLKDLRLPSLIQLNCMERNTAKLTIETSGKYGFVYFDAGQVVHAEFDPDIGEEAVARLLSLYAGNFKVESGIRAPMVTIKKHWNNLLLDCLHKVDDSEDSPDRKYDHLFERLFTVRGVQAISIINEQAEVVAASDPSAPDKDPLFGFVRLQAGQMGDAIGYEKPDFVSIAVTGKKFIVTHYNTLDVVIEVESKVKLDVVLPLIKQALN